MTPKEWRTVREVFEAALLVEPARQAAWLAEQCGSEKQLHDAVWRLLQGHQVATQFLDRVQGSLAPFLRAIWRDEEWAPTSFST